MRQVAEYMPYAAADAAVGLEHAHVRRVDRLRVDREAPSQVGTSPPSSDHSEIAVLGLGGREVITVGQ